MILKALREEVLEANLELVRRGLVLYTFGNASGIARDEGLVVIKPSGVPYDKMKAVDLVVADLDGKIVEGSLRPSSDLPTHLILYREFESIGGIAHTHSRAATAWAQAQREIPCFGTTHADYFHGPIPVTKPLTPAQIRADYEANTGHSIVRRFAKLDPLHLPAVLVAGHARSAGAPLPRKRRILRLSSRKSRRWHFRRSQSIPKRAASRSICMISISAGSMGATPITDRASSQAGRALD